MASDWHEHRPTSGETDDGPPSAIFDTLSIDDLDRPERPLRDKINAARDLRDLIRRDPHRPIFHFVAPEGVANPFDPNGAIYWKGKYHLGYLYQKLVDGKRQHVWGHAVSIDLVHWTRYPDMLDIRPGDIEQGIFSGGAFVSREGIPHVAYFGTGVSANLLARALDDDLRHWEKLQERGALRLPAASPPHDYTVFDPHIWYDAEADRYYQISGGMKPAFFTSHDLESWQFVGSAVDRSDGSLLWFEDLSCPAFFRIGSKHVLLFISHELGAQYYIGSFADGKFTPETHGRMNWPGGTFFAPEQLADARGRNIVWGWIVQPAKPPHLPDHGWSGIMSLPRILSLAEAGTLQIEPAPELRVLRHGERREAIVAIAPDSEVTLGASGTSIEIEVELAGGPHAPFGVKVFASPDGREETVIRYEPARGELVIDFVDSSISGPVSIPAFIVDPSLKAKAHPDFRRDGQSFGDTFPKSVSQQRAPLELAPDETLKLRIYLDRSVIEVFANGRQAMAQIVYPELSTSTGVKLFSGGEGVAVRTARSWQMAAANAY